MGTEGEQLVAVGSRHMESAQAFAQQYDIPHFYNSYDALASDPEVEAVYFYSDYELAEWWGRTKVNRQNEKYGLDDTPIMIKGVIKGDTSEKIRCFWMDTVKEAHNMMTREQIVELKYHIQNLGKVDLLLIRLK